MEKEKYLAAIYRYKHLLDEQIEETSEVRGEISGITSERRMHVSFCLKRQGAALRRHMH